MNRIILNDGKAFIRNDDLNGLKTYYKENVVEGSEERDYWVDDTALFQQWFTLACTSGKEKIARCLYDEMYLKFDPISQSAVRPTFNYCKIVAKGKIKKSPIRRRRIISPRWLSVGGGSSPESSLYEWLSKIVEDNRKNFNGRLKDS
jgi:hypothetical protein